MKVAGNGQAAILTIEQLRELFTSGLTNPRDRLLFGICFYAGCRISEALQLRTVDITSTHIVFRKRNTKGNLATREVEITPSLALLLKSYNSDSEWLFPSGKPTRKFLSRNTPDRVLRQACLKLGFDGVSTHSFRRTSLTMMSSSGVPLRVIQKISGHSCLGTLQKYLDVTEFELHQALLKVNF